MTVPRAANPAAELLELPVDFDGDTRQLFRTGAAAVAVPGTALGLEEAHRRFGRVPWAELAAPAAAVARDGVELTAIQAYLHRILDPLLRHSPEGEAMYGREGRLPAGRAVRAARAGRHARPARRRRRGVLYRGELAEGSSRMSARAAGR